MLTACGLFVWLGGLRWLKPVAAFVMTLAGFIGAWAFTDRNAAPLVALPVVMAGIGIFAHKAVVVCLGGCLAAVLVLAGPLLITSEHSGSQPRTEEPSTALQRWELTESVQRIEALSGEIKQQTMDFFKRVPAGRKSLAMLAGLGVIGFGFFSWRLVCAATTSGLGTFLIISGMTLLLLYKGVKPFEMISQPQMLFGWLWLGMTSTGILLQCWLCPTKKNKQDAANQISNEGNKK